MNGQRIRRMMIGLSICLPGTPLAAPASGLPCAARTAEPPPAYWVCHAGSRRAIFEAGGLAASIELGSLDGISGLYALGPRAGLRGEISIADGRASIATMVNGEPVFSEERAGGAVFLVWGRAAIWQRVTIDRPLTSLADLEAAVEEMARRVGLDTATAFPFRIDAEPAALDYHIIFHAGDNGGPGQRHRPRHPAGGHGPKGSSRRAAHDLSAHQQAKHSFTLPPRTPVQLFGFWADAAGEGIYTHEGMRTHLHFIAVEGPVSGHVDDVRLPTESVLHLPAHGEDAP